MSFKSIINKLTLSSTELNVLRKLKNFRTHGASSIPRYDKMYGLCQNCSLRYLKDRSEMFRTWEHYSGDILFPVPITASDTTYPSQQYSNFPKYEGKQLDLRHSLAQHCINDLEDLSKTRGLIFLGVTLLFILTLTLTLTTVTLT